MQKYKENVKHAKCLTNLNKENKKKAERIKSINFAPETQNVF